MKVCPEHVCFERRLNPACGHVDKDHVSLLVCKFPFDLCLPLEVVSEVPLNLLCAVMLLQEVDLGLAGWPTELHLDSLSLD